MRDGALPPHEPAEGLVAAVDRSQLVKQQLRDKKGRWIEMGKRLKWLAQNGTDFISGIADAVDGEYVVAKDVRTAKGGHLPDAKIAAKLVEVIDEKARIPGKGAPGDGGQVAQKADNLPAPDPSTAVDLDLPDDLAFNPPGDWKYLGTLDEPNGTESYVFDLPSGNRVHARTRGAQYGDDVANPYGMAFALHQGDAGKPFTEPSMGKLLGVAPSVETVTALENKYDRDVPKTKLSGLFSDTHLMNLSAKSEAAKLAMVKAGFEPDEPLFNSINNLQNAIKGDKEADEKSWLQSVESTQAKIDSLLYVNPNLPKRDHDALQEFSDALGAAQPGKVEAKAALPENAPDAAMDAKSAVIQPVPTEKAHLPEWVVEAMKPAGEWQKIKLDGDGHKVDATPAPEAAVPAGWGSVGTSTVEQVPYTPLPDGYGDSPDVDMPAIADEGEHEALVHYTDQLYLDVNGYLRTGSIDGTDFNDPQDLDLVVGSLDGLIGKSTLKADSEFWRGMAIDPISLEVGSHITDKAFMSVSKKRQIAKGFSANLGGQPGALVRVKVPAGSHALDVNHVLGEGSAHVAEEEFILPRGTTLRIDSIKAPGEAVGVYGPGGNTKWQIEATVVTQAAETTKPVMHEPAFDPDMDHAELSVTMSSEANGPELNSLSEYTQTGFSEINHVARTGDVLPGDETGWFDAMTLEEAQAHITNLDSLLEKSTVTQPATVYRGMQTNHLTNLFPGATIEDAGFMSTSKTKVVGESFAWSATNDTALFAINLPAGSHAIDVDSHDTLLDEQEVILPRGSKIHIDSMQKAPPGSPYTYEVTASLVPNEAPSSTTLEKANDTNTPDNASDTGTPAGPGAADNTPGGTAATDTGAAPAGPGGPADVDAGSGNDHTPGGPGGTGGDGPGGTPSEGDAYDAATVKAVHDYTYNPHYTAINDGLRTDAPSPEYADTIAALDSAISASHTPTDLTLYRGLAGEFGTDLKVGSVVHDKAFQSWSEDPDVANEFATWAGKPATVVTMKLPAGSTALSTIDVIGPDHENAKLQEWVRPRGTAIKITADSTDANGVRHLTAEVADPNVSNTEAGAANKLNAPDAGAGSDSGGVGNFLPAPGEGGESPSPFQVLADPGKNGDGYYKTTDGAKLWGKYGAAGVLIRNTDENGVTRYLVVQRGKYVSSNVGKWQLPGGALNGNENDFQGTARETQEELGATDDFLAKLKPVGDPVKFDHPSGWHYSNITADAPSMFEPTVDGTETGDAKWVTKEELKALPLHPALEKVLDDVLGNFDKGDGKTIEVSKSEAQEVAQTATNDAAVKDVGDQGLLEEAVGDNGGLIDTSLWHKVGSQMGSNPGGVYEAPDGTKYYVKKSKSDSHAKNEVLADNLYKLGDVQTSDLKLADVDGSIGTASKMMDGAEANLKQKLKDAEYKKKLQEGFAMDAWMANWDVAGLVFDNVVTDKDGNPVRVDPGGALLWRAQGAPKGGAFGNSAGEWETLRDGSNYQATSLFGDMTDEQLKSSAMKVANISPGQIDAEVDKLDFAPNEAQKLKDTLKARRLDIMQRAGITEADLTPPTSATPDVTPDTAPDVTPNTGFPEPVPDTSVPPVPVVKKSLPPMSQRVEATTVDQLDNAPPGSDLWLEDDETGATSHFTKIETGQWVGTGVDDGEMYQSESFQTDLELMGGWLSKDGNELPGGTAGKEAGWSALEEPATPAQVTSVSTLDDMPVGSLVWFAEEPGNPDHFIGTPFKKKSNGQWNMAGLADVDSPSDLTSDQFANDVSDGGLYTDQHMVDAITPGTGVTPATPTPDAAPHTVGEFTKGKLITDASDLDSLPTGSVVGVEAGNPDYPSTLYVKMSDGEWAYAGTEAESVNELLSIPDATGVYTADDFNGTNSFPTIIHQYTKAGAPTQPDTTPAPDVTPEPTAAPDATPGAAPDLPKLNPGVVGVTPDGKKYVTNPDGDHLLVGTQVTSKTDGLTGTVKTIEGNGHYVKVLGPDGKVKGRKISTLSVQKAAPSVAPEPAPAPDVTPEPPAPTPTPGDVVNDVQELHDLPPGSVIDYKNGNGTLTHFIKAKDGNWDSTTTWPDVAVPDTGTMASDSFNGSIAYAKLTHGDASAPDVAPTAAGPQVGDKVTSVPALNLLPEGAIIARNTSANGKTYWVKQADGKWAYKGASKNAPASSSAVTTGSFQTKASEGGITFEGLNADFPPPPTGGSGQVGDKIPDAKFLDDLPVGSRFKFDTQTKYDSPWVKMPSGDWNKEDSATIFKSDVFGFEGGATVTHVPDPNAPEVKQVDAVGDKVTDAKHASSLPEGTVIKFSGYSGNTYTKVGPHQWENENSGKEVESDELNLKTGFTITELPGKKSAPAAPVAPSETKVGDKVANAEVADALPTGSAVKFSSSGAGWTKNADGTWTSDYGSTTTSDDLNWHNGVKLTAVPSPAPTATAGLYPGAPLYQKSQLNNFKPGTQIQHKYGDNAIWTKEEDGTWTSEYGDSATTEQFDAPSFTYHSDADIAPLQSTPAPVIPSPAKPDVTAGLLTAQNKIYSGGKDKLGPGSPVLNQNDLFQQPFDTQFVTLQSDGTYKTWVKKTDGKLHDVDTGEVLNQGAFKSAFNGKMWVKPDETSQLAKAAEAATPASTNAPGTGPNVTAVSQLDKLPAGSVIHMNSQHALAVKSYGKNADGTWHDLNPLYADSDLDSSAFQGVIDNDNLVFDEAAKADTPNPGGPEGDAVKGASELKDAPPGTVVVTSWDPDAPLSYTKQMDGLWLLDDALTGKITAIGSDSFASSIGNGYIHYGEGADISGYTPDVGDPVTYHGNLSVAPVGQQIILKTASGTDMVYTKQPSGKWTSPQKDGMAYDALSFKAAIAKNDVHYGEAPPGAGVLPAQAASPATPGSKITDVKVLNDLPVGSKITHVIKNTGKTFTYEKINDHTFKALATGGELDVSDFGTSISIGGLVHGDGSTAVTPVPAATPTGLQAGDLVMTFADLEQMPIGAVLDMNNIKYTKDGENHWQAGHSTSATYTDTAFDYSIKNGMLKVDSLPESTATPTGKPKDPAELDVLPTGAKLTYNNPVGNTTIIYTKNANGDWEDGVTGNALSSTTMQAAMDHGIVSYGDTTEPKIGDKIPDQATLDKLPDGSIIALAPSDTGDAPALYEKLPSGLWQATGSPVNTKISGDTWKTANLWNKLSVHSVPGQAAPEKPDWTPGGKTLTDAKGKEIGVGSVVTHPGLGFTGYVKSMEYGKGANTHVKVFNPITGKTHGIKADKLVAMEGQKDVAFGPSSFHQIVHTGGVKDPFAPTPTTGSTGHIYNAITPDIPGGTVLMDKDGDLWHKYTDGTSTWQSNFGNGWSGGGTPSNSYGPFKVVDNVPKASDAKSKYDYGQLHSKPVKKSTPTKKTTAKKTTPSGTTTMGDPSLEAGPQPLDAQPTTKFTPQPYDYTPPDPSTSDVDTSSKWYGQPQPVAPEKSVVGMVDYTPPGWLAEAEVHYHTHKNPQKTIQQSGYWSKVEAVMQTGSLPDLEKIKSSNLISQKLYDDAKTQIAKATAANKGLDDKYKKVLEVHSQDVKDWAAANGIKNRTAGQHLPLSAEPFLGGEADWSKAHPSTATAPNAVELVTADTVNARRGVSFAVDSDAIEDMDVRVFHNVDAAGNGQLEFKFKVTAWAGDQLTAGNNLQNKGFTSEHGVKYKTMKTDPKTGLKQYTTTDQYSGSGTTYKWTDPATGIRVEVQRMGSGNTANDAPAAHNVVRVFAPDGMDHTALIPALEKLGIEATPADEASIRIFAENKMISILGGRTNSISIVKGSAARQKILDDIEAKFGITLGDLHYTYDSNNRLKVVLSDAARDKIIAYTGLSGFKHSFSGGGEADRWVNVLSGSITGLVPTHQRWSEGIGKSGQSSGQDMNHAGADHIFATIQKGAMTNSGHGSQIVMHPKAAARRLDYWAKQGDGWGKRPTNGNPVDQWKSSPYETVFKGGIPVADMWYVTMSSATRDQVIAKLKARGVTQINGIPIENFILGPGMSIPKVDESQWSTVGLPPAVTV